MKIIFPIFVFSLLCFTQCQSQKQSNENKQSQTKTMTQKPNIITLKEGETTFFKEYEMNITFSTVAEDSRCPEGVNCIWAGVGVAQMTLMGTYTRPTTINLATNTFLEKGYENSTVFNGYRISLKNLSPYPSENNPSTKLKGKYVIDLEIVKIPES